MTAMIMITMNVIGTTNTVAVVSKRIFLILNLRVSVLIGLEPRIGWLAGASTVKRCEVPTLFACWVSRLFRFLLSSIGFIAGF
jgi:hypothetical protein